MIKKQGIAKKIKEIKYMIESDILKNLPVFGICGYSNSGKTTLILQAVKHLKEQGFKVAVVKHDVHGLNIDWPGKDTYRHFENGADIYVQGPNQEFLRNHIDPDRDFITSLIQLSNRYDVILTEGHKRTPFPKVWLYNDKNEQPPEYVKNVQAKLAKDNNRINVLKNILDKWIQVQASKTPIYACILPLIKPNSYKSDMDFNQNIKFLEKYVAKTIIIGQKPPLKLPENTLFIPGLPSIVSPLSEILTAMRWAPNISWIFLSENLLNINEEVFSWLLNSCKPGVWACLPQLPDSFQETNTFLAYLNCRAYHMLETLAYQKDSNLSNLIKSTKILLPSIPKEFI